MKREFSPKTLKHGRVRAKYHGTEGEVEQPTIVPADSAFEAMVFTGDKKVSAVEYTLTRYNSEMLETYSVPTIEEALGAVNDFDGVVWLNITGLHDVPVIVKACETLQVHRLVTEDILNVGHHPKFEEHTAYVFVILREFLLGDQPGDLQTEQMSFILKGNLLITFRESAKKLPGWVRSRLNNPQTMIRQSRSADTLLYALLYATIDSYLALLERVGDQLDLLEEKVLANPEESLLTVLYSYRREIITLRRGIFPLREIVSRFEKLESHLVSSQTKEYMRDLSDHAFIALEAVDYYRDAISSLLELYMNSVSNRMNEIMKVLTVMSSIFIPLTFIAGVYGMNFEYMPLLHHHYSYFVVLFVMLTMFITMFIFFRRRKWI